MCTGIERVMVNGQWAFAQGQALPQRAGRFLSRPGALAQAQLGLTLP
jgi:hypothetical protein